MPSVSCAEPDHRRPQGFQGLQGQRRYQPDPCRPLPHLLAPGLVDREGRQDCSTACRRNPGSPLASRDAKVESDMTEHAQFGWTLLGIVVAWILPCQALGETA